MEGLARQVRLLYAALQPLGLQGEEEKEADAEPAPRCLGALPEEVATELHLALARATALAHWAVTAQREQRQHQQQTLATIADTLGVAVAQLREWNPQLPASLPVDDVLPPDTYLKVQAPAPPRRSSPRPPLPAAPLSAPTTAAHGRTTASSSPSSSAPRARQSVPAPTPTVAGPSSHNAALPQMSAAAAATLPVLESAAPSAAAAATTRGDSVPTHRQKSPSSSVHASAGNLSGRSGAAAVGGGGGRSSTPGGATHSGSGSGSLAVPRSSEGGASQGRYSVWTAGSGRGASGSPPVPEPSMPQCGTDDAPPSCAPPPMLMVRPSSPRYCCPPDGADLVDLTETAEGAAAVVSSAVLAAPPPFHGVAERSRSRTSFPRRGSGGDGGGGSVTSGRAIRTRGSASHSRSLSPLDEASLAVVGRGAPAANTPTAPSRPQPHTAATPTAVHGSPVREASTTLSAVSPPSSMDDGRRSESGPRGAGGPAHAEHTGATEPRAAAAAAATAAAAAAPSTTAGRHTPRRSPTRATPVRKNGGGGVQGGDFTTPLLQRRRPRSPPQHGGSGGATTASATTPWSLSTTTRLSDDVDCSPVTPSTSSAGGPRGRGAMPDRTPYGETPRSDTGDASVAGADTDAEDEEEAMDRTPSTRPPALLGRHVCSPPPNLNRAARPPAQTPASTSHRTATATAAVGAARRLVSPRTAHATVGRWAAADAAAAGAPLGASPVDSTPSSPSASSLSSPAPRPEMPPPRRGPAGAHDAAAATAVVVASSYSDTDEDGGDDAMEEAELAGEGEGEGDEDYDTLDGIAAAYNLSVSTIVEWNPYLRKYRPSEPLPPDLPIVLPMSDADEEATESDVVDGGSDGAEAREVTSQLLPPASRLGSRESDIGGLRGNVVENSPVPLPPR